jgi:hypothetical protein
MGMRMMGWEDEEEEKKIRMGGREETVLLSWLSVEREGAWVGGTLRVQVEARKLAPSHRDF